MYLHLGGDKSVPLRNVVGIFDIENTTTGKSTGKIFDKATREGRVVNLTYEMPKSFVICMEKGREIIYISQISVSTLRKRTGNFPEGKIRTEEDL